MPADTDLFAFHFSDSDIIVGKVELVDVVGNFIKDEGFQGKVLGRKDREVAQSSQSLLRSN